jgi:hypothetical protein
MPCLLAVWLVAAAAQAQLPATGADLAWNAPSSCLSREAVLGETARLLAAAARRIPLRARADVAREGDGQWTATLSVSAGGATSQRVLRAESCQGIASAVAVVLAVAIEGPIEEAGRPTPRAVDPERGPALSSQVPSHARRSSLLVGAGGALSVDTTPSAAPGVEGTAGWLVGSPVWRVRSMATVEAFWPNTTAQGEGGTFFLWTTALRACLDRALGDLEIGPCAVAELESMRGSSVHAATNSHGSAAWVAAGASIHGAWSFTRALALFARVDGLAPLARPTFVIYSPVGDIFVHQPSRFAIGASLGLEAHFF